LILLLLGTTGPLLVMAVGNAWFSYRAERQRIDSSSEAIARGIAGGVSREVQRAVAGLQALALSRPLCVGDLPEFRRQVASFVQDQHPGANVLLSDRAGQQLLNLLSVEGARLPRRRNIIMVERVVRSGKPQVSDLYEGTFLERVVTVDVPVFCDKELRFVLTLAPPVHRLRDVLLQQAPPASWSVILLDSRGVAIATVLGDGHAGDLGAIDMEAGAAGDGSGAAVPQVAARPGMAYAVSRAADIGWTVVVERPLRSVNLALWRSLVLLVGSAMLFSLAGAWIAVSVARTIIRPIDRLSRLAARPEGADRPLPPSGMQEIDVVAARLQSALQQIRLAGRRKDDFIATLAHELRNPLAPVRNAVTLLQLREQLTPEGRRLTGVAERQLRQMDRLISDLLDLSRIGQGKVALNLQRTDVCDCVQAAVESVAQRLEQRLQVLSLDLPTHPLPVRGDPVRITQVLSNLLDNASKYSLEGGRVDLRAARDRDWVLVTVKDDGVGLQPDHLAQVFDMFWQVGATGGSTGGMGIGLALVRRLVELHGGCVGAASEGPGKGSTFTVRLRLDSPDARADASPGEGSTEGDSA
jgi:signal transduction histidine kinase